jgi:hypothetical protein
MTDDRLREAVAAIEAERDNWVLAHLRPIVEDAANLAPAALLDLDGKPFCPSGSAQRYHAIGECDCARHPAPAAPRDDRLREALDLVGHDIHRSFWGGVADRHNTQPDGEPFGDCYKCRVVAERLRKSFSEHGLALAPDPRPAALDGASLIAAERQRQIEVEGYGPEHDEDHAGELATAGAAYATDDRNLWPWSEGAWKPTPGDPVRQLVKAGALIAAAIDALEAPHD